MPPTIPHTQSSFQETQEYLEMLTCYLVHRIHVCTYTYLHAHTDMHTCKCVVHAHLNIGCSILRMIISSLSMSYTVKQVKFEWSDCGEERQPYQKATKAANVSPGIWRLLDRNRCSQALDTAPGSGRHEPWTKGLGESASFEEGDNPQEVQCHSGQSCSVPRS